MVERLLYSEGFDEDGDIEIKSTKFQKQMKERIVAQVDGAIENIAAKNVLPNVEQYLLGFAIERTNQWGERKGEPVSFVEYITGRADEYIREKVDSQGRSKAEAGGYSWSAKQERLAYLIDKHLQYAIENSLAKNLKTVQESIAESVAETVRLRLKEVTTKINVAVKS
ncbi:MAG: hypothetical protein AAGK93_00525 [Pseudomonadota bacterium]